MRRTATAIAAAGAIACAIALPSTAQAVQGECVLTWGSGGNSVTVLCAGSYPDQFRAALICYTSPTSGYTQYGPWKYGGAGSSGAACGNGEEAGSAGVRWRVVY
ncbi:hypothetical protein EDD40_2836 [Saccharothrix texasensis]|uniref:Beta/gamma crystallin n=1 Tax=Saccharothrix texasensis TaxID=103734 RepID=A0A3N1H4Q4_9PSEU|nr:hypothetical protein EDD40_2836 [Saccharothrix texasensis]